MRRALSVHASPPPKHSAHFRRRRFWNWLALGVTYAAFYVGRYNLAVASGAIMKTFALSKGEFGTIATAGFWTYAASVVLNGPLTDRYGGRRAILLGAAGTAAMNFLIGVAFLSGWQTKVVVGMSLMHALNQYFQSFGTPSVVKVNSHWFHVRERGAFAAIFAVMISSGYFLAMTVGAWILAELPWYCVFLIPSAAIGVMLIVDWLVICESPRQAGLKNFRTGDASSGRMDNHRPINAAYVIAHVLRNKVILTLAAAEFCTGFIRQGLLLWFTPFLNEVHGVAPGSTLYAVALGGVAVGGISGGLLCGWMSDRLFQSRRPPAAFLFYMAQIGAFFILGETHDPAIASVLVGFCCMSVFGAHGVLTGAAAMDFGGTKAAATVAGLLDGVHCFASGLTGFLLGGLIDTHGWGVWTYAIMPFSLAGALLMLQLWNATPENAEAG